MIVVALQFVGMSGTVQMPSTRDRFVVGNPRYRRPRPSSAYVFFGMLIILILVTGTVLVLALLLQGPTYKNVRPTRKEIAAVVHEKQRTLQHMPNMEFDLKEMVLHKNGIQVDIPGLQIERVDELPKWNPEDLGLVGEVVQGEEDKDKADTVHSQVDEDHSGADYEPNEDITPHLHKEKKTLDNWEESNNPFEDENAIIPYN